MSEERGPTWSEEHRHACEVDFIARLPSRERRRRYFDGWTTEQGRVMPPLARSRGEEAVEKLRKDVRDRFNAIRDGTAGPISPAGEAGAAAQGVHGGGERVCTTSVPTGGSSLAITHASSSDPASCVDSGVGA